MATALGITLLREAALFAACLADDARLAAMDESAFEDATVRRGLVAAKRLRDKPNAADLATLRGVCRTLWGVEGDGKLLDGLAELVARSTADRRRARQLRCLQRNQRSMTASEFVEAVKRIE